MYIVSIATYTCVHVPSHVEYVAVMESYKHIHLCICTYTYKVYISGAWWGVAGLLRFVQGKRGDDGMNGTDGTPGARGRPGKQVRSWHCLLCHWQLYHVITRHTLEILHGHTQWRIQKLSIGGALPSDHATLVIVYMRTKFIRARTAKWMEKKGGAVPPGPPPGSATDTHTCSI